MHVIAGTSYKGGVGKTTLNSGLVCAIKKMFPRLRVLFIDSTEMQGSRSLRFAPQLEMDGRGLGLVLFTVFGAMSKKADEGDLGSHFERALDQAEGYFRDSLVEIQVDPNDDESVIHFLPAAGALLQEVMDERWYEPRRGFVLEQVLRRVEKDFDICVFDVSPNPKSRTTSSILNLAEAVVSVFDVRTVDTLIGFDLYLKELAQSEVKHAGGIANMFEKDWADSREALETLSSLSSSLDLKLWEVPLGASVINTLRCVELPNGRMSSGVYTQLAQAPSQRRNLLPIAEKIELIAKAVVNPLLGIVEPEELEHA